MCDADTDADVDVYYIAKADADADADVIFIRAADADADADANVENNADDPRNADADADIRYISTTYLVVLLICNIAEMPKKNNNDKIRLYDLH